MAINSIYLKCCTHACIFFWVVRTEPRKPLILIASTIMCNYTLDKMNDRLREAHKYSGLFYFEYFLDIEYAALNSFLVESENLINSKEKELENKIDKWKTDRLSYNDAPEPFEMYENNILEFNQFSALLNNSFFIMSYSIFERNLYEICSYCQKEEGEQASVKDVEVKGYIDQCRKYIVDAIGVNLSNIQNEWSEVKKYQKLRNSFAHNNGVLVKLDKNLIDFIERNKDIKIHESTKTIAIDSIQFISDFTELIKVFISKLLNEIDRQKRVGKLPITKKN